MISYKKALLVSTAAAATLGLALAPALADPPNGVTPRHVDIVGTGSDTTQLVVDQFSTNYNATIGPKPAKLYSFDAVSTDPNNPLSATIQEKKGCDANRTRPVGSSAGIAELEANLQPSGDTTDYCVDFARSSRARATTDPESIVFIPFAIDGVTWSADTANGKSNAPGSLSTKDLQAIYSCDASIINKNDSGPVTWDEVGGTGTDQVAPVIPQSSSGTRAFFLKSIGVTTPGNCVAGNDNSVDENEGSNPIFTGSTAKDIVFPYSVAVYLQQSQNGHDTGGQGPLVLRNVNKESPTVGQTGSLQINTNFPYLREVFNVVRNASTTGGLAVPGYLQKIFGNGAGKSGYVCSKGAKAIQSYGFLPDPVCGTLE